jgi:hypothetical protein
MMYLILWAEGSHTPPYTRKVKICDNPDVADKVLEDIKSDGGEGEIISLSDMEVNGSLFEYQWVQIIKEAPHGSKVM